MIRIPCKLGDYKAIPPKPHSHIKMRPLIVLNCQLTVQVYNKCTTSSTNCKKHPFCPGHCPLDIGHWLLRTWLHHFQMSERTSLYFCINTSVVQCIVLKLLGWSLITLWFSFAVKRVIASWKGWYYPLLVPAFLLQKASGFCQLTFLVLLPRRPHFDIPLDSLLRLLLMAAVDNLVIAH